PNLLRHSPQVEIYQESVRGVPEYVSGKLSGQVTRGSEVTAALEFFKKNLGAFRIAEPELELVVDRVDEDRSGNRHIRFQQHHNGVRVYGGNLAVHYNKAGELRTVNGKYQPGLELSVSPALPVDRAVALARADLNGFFGAAEPGEAELVVFPWEGTNYLAWRLYLLSDSPPGRWEYFVEANTGEIIYKANRIMPDEAIGTGIGVMGDTRDHIDTWYTGSSYQMLDYTRQLNNNIHGHDGQMPDGSYIVTNIAGATLPGSLATDADNVWDDTLVQVAAVDGHTYTSLMYDWLLSAFGRNSYSDQGSTMLTIVNYSGDGDNNAYWDGSRIVIWSWSVGWRSLAGCPDVIAHEWGHAVTERVSGLVYQKESGALNESFSDMMGAAFEFAHDSLDIPDWYIGENGVINGNGFRLMAYPAVYGDPEIYGEDDPNWVDVENCTPSDYNDYCGVHTNSGVGNKWFYLLSDGGENLGVTVTGIGVANAIQIAYQANAYYWTALTDYHDAAIGTYFAAMDLDPSGAWAQQVINAWHAVNVSTPAPGLVFSPAPAVPDFISAGGEDTMDIEVSGYFGGVPVEGTGWFHYAVNGSPYTVAPMISVSPNHYRFSLPNVTCGDVLEFYFSAEEESGGRFYFPDTTAPFSPMVATLVDAVFTDNFELDEGWTVSGDASDGHWSRGVPAGYGERGDPPADFDGSGQCFLTDNVYGNSDVDNGTTYLISPVFDLAYQNALIKYARWYSNDFGDMPYTNVMTVYISNNGGINWELVETVGPSEKASGGWYEHSFFVADFVPPSSNMKLRFEVADTTGAVVEAAVDAVTVSTFDCILYICGDANCSEGEPDIADITRIIDYLYISHAPLCEPLAADVNDSGGDPDISDITQLINHLYLDKRDLVCQNSK
ncbi:MAG: M4 family metallopeptidase, partial [Candidatus Zixiibacteriota bacterium]